MFILSYKMQAAYVAIPRTLKSSARLQERIHNSLRSLNFFLEGKG